MKSRSLLIVVILFLSELLVSQSEQATPQKQPTDSPAQSLAPEPKAKIEQLAKLQKHFGKDMNSPGVELSLKEVSRSHSADRTLVTYGLYATGFPPKASFTLYQVQLDGSVVKTLERVTLTKQGQAICGGEGSVCQGNGPDDPVDLIVYAAKGEPKRFALFSDDESHSKGFVSVVPFPNAATDKGCKLESVIGTQNGELTFIQGSGFKSNADLNIDGQSYGEDRQYTAKASMDGSYFATLMPYVLGKKSGKTVFEVKSRTCSTKLTFEWGENSYHLE
jgi:hypothetical protein